MGKYIVIWRTFYSAQNCLGNCPPATYAPVISNVLCPLNLFSRAHHISSFTFFNTTRIANVALKKILIAFQFLSITYNNVHSYLWYVQNNNKIPILRNNSSWSVKAAVMTSTYNFVFVPVYVFLYHKKYLFHVCTGLFIGLASGEKNPEHIWLSWCWLCYWFWYFYFQTNTWGCDLNT